MWEEVDSLDADNLAWTRTYVKTLEARVAKEAASPEPDDEMLVYVRQELENYQRLLNQVTGGGA
jgi:hypothetical protein